jgi:ABC-type multidrug transport system permease subunit
MFDFFNVAFYQISSVIVSLLSLSWSMVCYEQSNRWANPDKPQMTLAGCVIQLFWRFFMVASRVIVLALFATCFKLELFTFLGLHWLLMTLWILMMAS